MQGDTIYKMDFGNNSVNNYFDISCDSFLGMHYFQRNQLELDKSLAEQELQITANTATTMTTTTTNDQSDTSSTSSKSSSTSSTSSSLALPFILRQIRHLECLLLTCDLKGCGNPPPIRTSSPNASGHLPNSNELRNGLNRQICRDMLRDYYQLFDREMNRITPIPTPPANLPQLLGELNEQTLMASLKDIEQLLPPNRTTRADRDREKERIKQQQQLQQQQQASMATSMDTSSFTRSNSGPQQQTSATLSGFSDTYTSPPNQFRQAPQTQQQPQTQAKQLNFQQQAQPQVQTQSMDLDEDQPPDNPFKSAKVQLIENQEKKNKQQQQMNQRRPLPTTSAAPAKTNAGKVIGIKRKGFIAPYKQDDDDEYTTQAPPDDIVQQPSKKTNNKPAAGTGAKPAAGQQQQGKKDDESNPGGITNVNGVQLDDERLRNVEPRMLELICNEILDKKQTTSWNDIAGLQDVKKQIKEIATLPLLRPDIFKGLRNPPKGILLFGPPGTGKTMIGKAIANDVNATFFSISASSLTSKWIGDGEKMVRALFAVARCYLPSIIFIDEIDSLLTQRSDGENEASRRIKTEFLVQWDGVSCNAEDRMLLIGATNRPEELDEAARRRLVKRLYIPLPEYIARYQLIQHLVSKEHNEMTEDDIQRVAEKTEGYSGSDLKALCTEAAMESIRSITDIETTSLDDIPPITVKDFLEAVNKMKPSVAQSELKSYIAWNKEFGGR
ncbi:hypothetical protein SAMD00019534_013110 [Acytostelium subglobosum LB1]|uniref:hypothetical protein n=1 Tax=Acytostelium subglobosum LB1 TaxID=1410327 RepID=UPI0006451CFF|nr:hypothetical protein SAMD00019534_013110 [Acytostelium subglobosum LB1]GAM18136.1 hypothetical protein SAMD00019534_013110 [Acytostelium subglobosum LB1]|eukprot:XP_012758732.1 hypothetical protein SAMD00019534_013110 [Acytostelium subglobosum LB1]